MKIDIQEKVTVEALLDSKVTRLVMNSKFVRKQEFKLEKNRKMSGAVHTGVEVRRMDLEVSGLVE